MTHDELMNSLAGHLRASTKRMVWCDTQLGPSGTCRPDVFTIDKSFAHFAADAYECKVTVSDLRSDVTSGKWQKYRRYAHRVWFAFPRGMAPLSEIPRECGVILLGEGWRAARKPVAQVLDTLPRDAWLKLLIEGAELPGEIRPRRADEWAVADAIRRKFGVEVAELFQDRQRAAGSFQYATERLRAQTAELEEQMRANREHRLQWERGQRARLDERYRDLASALGLAEDCGIDDLTQKLAETCRALNSKYRLTQLIEALQALEAIGMNLASGAERAAA